jgi:hypothetical protein
MANDIPAPAHFPHILSIAGAFPGAALSRRYFRSHSGEVITETDPSGKPDILET